MEELNYTGKIAAKNVVIAGEDQIVPIILQKMKNGVESIKMNPASPSEFPLDEILAISQVQNSPYLQINYYDQPDVLHKVAQVWIDNNAEIGFTFQLSAEIHTPFHEFTKHFADRIVSKNEKRVRIRTNNPDRHILLERSSDETDDENNDEIEGRIVINIKYYRLIVISAKMRESEYNDNCLEWISKMFSYDVRERENNQEQNGNINENPEIIENDDDDEDW